MTKKDKSESDLGLMVKIMTVLIMMAVGVMSASKSQAQTSSDKRGQAYFEQAAATLCGTRVQVRFSTDRAYVYVDEDLENRNLNEMAHNLALDGLNAFPKSRSFYVEIQDSKRRGSAEVQR